MFSKVLMQMVSSEHLSCSITQNLPQVGSSFVVFVESATDNLLIRRSSPNCVPANKNDESFRGASHFTGYLLVDILRWQSLSSEVMRTMVPCRTGFNGSSNSTTSNSSKSSIHSRKKWEPGNLVPSRFSGEIRKVEARLGKLAKIRKVETD